MRSLFTSCLLVACVASSLAAEVKAPKRPTSFSSQSAQPRDGGGFGHGGGGGGHGGGGHGGGGAIHGGGGLGGGGDLYGGGGSIHGGGGGGLHGGGGGLHGGGGGLHGGGGGGLIGGGDSYGTPPGPSYHEEPAKDTGFYYYYYPVVPEGGGGGKKKGGLFSSGKGFFGKMMETIMYPIMYPIMRMYDYFDGRALTARASDYLPMQLFDKITAMIEEEIYKEECLSRMICQLGKSAEGYETFIHLSDFFVPEEYQSHLVTFKNSALKKTDCALKYKCLSLDPAHKL